MDGEVVVRTFDFPHEAELAAAYLRAQGIPARIDNDVIQGMNPMLSLALGGVRLYVSEDHASAAFELLEEVRVRPEPDKIDDADRVVGKAVLSALAGYFILPVIGNLYSLWLLSRVSKAELSRRGRRDLIFALFLDVLMLGFIVYILTA